MPSPSPPVAFRLGVYALADMLIPKLFTTLRAYDRRQFVADVGAGVIVAVVALPLAIAFGIASGVTPHQGIVTAIVAGFLISALGGSRVQIGGPTGAFVVIVYGIVQEHGYPGLAIATIMAGVMLIGLGLAGLGGAIKFIPFSVTTGFTAGIAVLIASSQIKDFLGLEMGAVPADFLERWDAYSGAVGSYRPAAVAIAVSTLAVLILWPQVSRRIPSALIALIATTFVVHTLGLEVETIGSRFGELRTTLPRPALPVFSWSSAQALIGASFTIAMLGAIESLLSAVVADGMIGGRHRSNMELVAQGVANIVSPLFGGIPATGAIARTATNIKNGGRTPVAGLVHALALLLILTFFGKWAALIPLAALSAILLLVAYHMSEWRAFVAEIRGAPRSDVGVMLATFSLTVVADLTVAIQVGVVLAAFLFMKRMAEVTNISAITGDFEDGGAEEDGPVERRRDVPRGVEIYAIDGPFFFGAAEKFKDTMGQIAAKPLVLIIQMQRVPAIDSTGLNALRDLVHRTRREGTRVMLSGLHAQPMIAIGRSRLLDELGDENLFGNLEEALAGAREHLASSRSD